MIALAICLIVALGLVILVVLVLGLVRLLGDHRHERGNQRQHRLGHHRHEA